MVMHRRGWMFAGICGLTGLVFAIGTVFTRLHGAEAVLAPSGLIVVGLAAVFVGPKAPTRVAMLGGFVMALAAVWTQGLLLDSYLAKHPEYRDVAIPFGLRARAWTLGMAPVGAVAAGVISAAVAAVADAALRGLGYRR